MDPITFEQITAGYAAYQGPLKLAVITTSEHRGLFRHGRMIYEAMPREAWSIHWTSPSQSISVVEAVLAALPTEPSV